MVLIIYACVPCVEDVDNEIILLMEEVKAQAAESRRFSSVVICSSIAIPKLAICLQSDEHEHHHYSATTDHSDGAVSGAIMTFAVYGLKGLYEQGHIVNDSSLHLGLGAIKLFGVQGVEMVSCGVQHTEEEAERDVSDISSMRSTDAALSLRLGFYVIEDDFSDGTDDEAAARAIERITYGPKRHIVVEVVLANLSLLWHEQSVSYLQRQYTEYYQTAHAPTNDTAVPIHSDSIDGYFESHVFSSIRQKCALYAMNKSASYGGAIASTKWSVDMLMMGICLDIPFLESNSTANCFVAGLPDYRCDTQGHMNFTFGPLHAISGDFLPLSGFSIASGLSQSEKEDTLGDIPSRQLWPHVDRILNAKLSKLRSAVIHPISLSITGITVSIVRIDTNGGQTNQEVLEPWHLKGFVSHSLLPCHPIYPDLQLDIYAAPLIVSCTDKDAFDMYSAICSILHPIVSHENSMGEAGGTCVHSPVGNPQQVTRIRNLAPLCVLKANINIDEVSYTLLADEDISVTDALRDIFTSCCKHILERGSFARVSHTSERLAIQRLKKYDVDARAAELALRSVCAAAESSEQEAKHVIERLVTQFASNVPSQVVHPAIIAYVFNGIHFSYYSLTYDLRTTFHIEEVLVTDYDSSPIVHLFCDNMGHYDSLSVNSKMKTAHKETRKNPNSAKRKPSYARPMIESIAKKLEATSIASYCALGITYTQHDADYGWGAGGGSVRSLYGGPVPMPNTVREISISLKNVDTLLCTTGIPRVLHSSLPLIAALYSQYIRLYSVRKYRSMKRNLMENGGVPTKGGLTDALPPSARSEEPRVKYSFQVSVDCAHFVLADSTNYLAELAVKGTRASFSTSRCDGRRTKMAQLIRASVHAIELHDLSPAGNLHPSVITRDSSVKSDMITVLATSRRRSTEVSVSVVGLRICVLYRFLSEVLTFLMDHFTKKIMEERDAFYTLLARVDNQVLEELLQAEDDMDAESDETDEGDEAGSDTEAAPHDGFFEYPTLEVDTKDTLPLSSLKQRYTLFGIEGTVLDRSRSGMDFSRHNSADSAAQYMSTTSAENCKKELSHQYDWKITISDGTMVMPRGSASNDLVAATIAKCVISHRREAQSWSGPDSSVIIDDRQEALFFNYDRNGWEKAHDANLPSLQQGRQRSTNVTEPPPKYDTYHPAFFLEEKTIPSNGKDHLADPASAQSHESVEGSDDISEADFLSADGGSDSKEENDSDIDMDQFEDARDVPEQSTLFPSAEPNESMYSQTPYSSTTYTRFPRTDSGEDDGLSPWAMSSEDDDEVHDAHPGPAMVSRYIVEMEGVELYCSLDGPLCVQTQHANHMQENFRRFGDIQNDLPVYSIIHNKRAQSQWSSQRWSLVTMVPMNLLVIVDYEGEAMRMLFSETANITTVHLKLSMAQFYLLMSVYYDNMNEKDEFTGPVKSVRSDSGDEFPNQEAYFSQHPEYGTSSFCNYVRQAVSTTDLVVVRSDIFFECEMDCKEYFPREMYSFRHVYGPKPAEDRGSYRWETYPFATIRLMWATMQVSFSKDVMQIALGVSEVGIADTRSNNPKYGAHVMKVIPPALTDDRGQRTEAFKHGYADFDYGLKEGPNSIRCPIDLPLKVTYFSTGNTWGVCNVGADAPDFDLKNLEIVWLLTDYFSLYFCREEYGNPAVIAYGLVDPSMWPYGGIDTRVFVTRPHIQTYDSSSISQCLMVEADTGVYFRYIYDTDFSVKMDLHVTGLVVVLLKSYKPPLMSRGLRGTAGSGRGIRTVMEGISLKYACNFDKKRNVVDYMFSLFPDVTESKRKAGFSGGESERPFDSTGNMSAEPPRAKDDDSNDDSWQTTYVNFDDNACALQAVRIPTPKAVSPLHIPSRDFPRQCCSVISSFEDSLFTVTLIMDFLGFDEAAEEAKSPTDPMVMPPRDVLMDTL